MNAQFKGKILVMATLAALIGMDGFFSLIDRQIRGAGNETATQLHANEADMAVIPVPRFAPQALCTENDSLFGNETELLNNDALAPLDENEFQWNADDQNAQRNAGNSAIGGLAPPQLA